jgi:threonine dehydrogenase-like Zn-dependent dehydrogenase
MKYDSIWVSAPGKLTVVTKELAEPKLDEVVVRVRACGVCGTDLHFYHDQPTGSLTPLGHEVAGTIHAVGKGVRNLEIGSDVVVQNHVACGRCDACLNQRPDACLDIQTYMNDQGGMGAYLVVPQAMVVPFSGLSYEEATLAEPVTVALDLCREAQIRLHDDVLVMGPGTIGLACVALAKAQGARRVVVVGHGAQSVRGRHRVATARRLGADDVFDSSEEHWKAAVKSAYPRGFDRVIVTSPPQTIVDGIELAGFRGWIVYDGISFTDDVVRFHANDFHFAKKRLIASHAIPNWGFPMALDLLREKTIPPDALLTHIYSLDDLVVALQLYGSSEVEIVKPVISIGG